LQISNYSKAWQFHNSIININPVKYYLMAATNKRLLISESHSDSNQCTPCRGYPDQHDTYASHASPRTLGLCFLRAVPIRDNHSWVVNRFGWIPLLLRKRAPDTIHSAPSVPSFSLKPANEAVDLSQASVDDQLLGLLGPETPACDRYVQYLLTGTNPSVLNRHRRGLPQNSHNTLTTLPFWVFHWSP
jgi:hypothetical protein